MPFLKKCKSRYPLHGMLIHKDHPETIFIVQENKTSKLLTDSLNVFISMFVKGNIQNKVSCSNIHAVRMHTICKVFQFHLFQDMESFGLEWPVSHLNTKV